MAKKSKLAEFIMCAEDALEDYKASSMPHVVPTGFPAIDNDLLGSGGFPVGKLIEIFGEPESHKSLVVYQIIASYQKTFPDKKVLLIDSENKLSDKFGLEWIAKQGVDLKRLDFTYCMVAEEILNLMIKAVKSEEYSLVVLDSLGNAEVTSNAIKEERFIRDGKTGKMKIDKIGEFAKTIGDGTKALVDAMALSESKTTTIIVNQVRSNLDPYGLEFLTPGGHVFHHNRGISLHFRNRKRIKDTTDKVLGTNVQVSLVRSIISPIGKTNEDNHLKIFYDAEGQKKARVEALITTAINKTIVLKKGAWITWGEQQFQGMSKFVQAILDDETLFDSLVKEIEGDKEDFLEESQESLYQEDTEVK